ncbi:hypothetical protein Micbo1qcDRAFT_216714 [Microdochium bolleyi]|uniref:Uncharacterized protein n=1 Tax=Microdochium bolleyi TaxID=196109 RepID=A0A136JD27_9PEZI|nr:hypothetical protein Micbo1qcDRAFT_216714 [Microdochium bolleyi]
MSLIKNTARPPQRPFIAPQPHIPFPALQALVARHQKATQSAPPPVLAVSGRYLPLVYHLVSTLISTPAFPPENDEPRHRPQPQRQRHCGYTVVIIDAECRFDVTRLVGTSPPPTPSATAGDAALLRSTVGDGQTPPTSAAAATPGAVPDESFPATPADLRHVYVYRPPHSQVRACLAAAGDFMLYGDHGSRDREWWGTVVVGSSGLSLPPSSSSSSITPAPAPTTAVSNPDVLCGYKGWLRVEREEVPAFHMAVSAEEALADRDRRAAAVGRAGWRAVSRWGSYSFGS